MHDDLASEATAQGDNTEIKAILEEVCRLTDMGFAAFARVTDQRWIACQVLDKIEFGLKPGDELDIKTTICNAIRQSGEAVVIDTVSGNVDWQTHPIPILYGFQSYASFPIYLADGSFFGTLCAIDPAPHNISVSETVATMAAYAKRMGAILSSPVAASRAE